MLDPKSTVLVMFDHFWPLKPFRPIGVKVTWLMDLLESNFFNEPEINIDFHLSWPFFRQNAARDIITSFAEKKETNQQSHPRWSWSSQSVLEKSPVDCQAVVAWQWPSSTWTSARKKLGISFAQVLLVFYRSTQAEQKLNKTWPEQTIDQCRRPEQPNRRALLWVEHSRQPL